MKLAGHLYIRSSVVTVTAVIAVLMVLPTPVLATPLRFVETDAKNIDCIFNLRCKIVTQETSASIPMPPNIIGKTYLHSRTFKGGKHSKAEGKTAYQYRIDFRKASSMSEAPCVVGLILTFGPVTQLPYGGVGELADVHVIKPENHAAVGLFAVEKSDNSIVFTFSQPLCAAPPGTGEGAESRVFGLTSDRHPKTAIVKVLLPDQSVLSVTSHVPTISH